MPRRVLTRYLKRAVVRLAVAEDKSAEFIHHHLFADDPEHGITLDYLKKNNKKIEG